jgi:hypothetical protein
VDAVARDADAATEDAATGDAATGDAATANEATGSAANNWAAASRSAAVAQTTSRVGAIQSVVVTCTIQPPACVAPRISAICR